MECQRIELYGVAIDDVTVTEAVGRVLDGSCEGELVFTPNAKMLMRCRKEPKYADLLNRATLSLPDGAGVLLAAKRKGTPLRERVAGIELAEALLCEAAKRGMRVFFLGGKQGVAERAAERLCRQYEGLRVCGCHDGYFEKQGEENRRLLGLINAARTEVLFVCFGFPMQEEWLVQNLSFLPSVRIALGLGGSLDVFAGDVRRAPKMLSRFKLEWLWRMLREPKRLRDLPELIRFFLLAPN